MPTFPCIPVGRTAPRSPSCWGRVRAPQTRPGDDHWWGVRAVAPLEWTHQSPVQPWHFQTHPGSRARTHGLGAGMGHSQPETSVGLPQDSCCRENTFPVLLVQGRMWEQQRPGSPRPWLCFQLHVGLQEQRGAGTAPSLLRVPRWLLSHWRCPRCPSRLPTNPERTWLLLLEVSRCWPWCLGFPSHYPGQDPASASCGPPARPAGPWY